MHAAEDRFQDLGEEKKKRKKGDKKKKKKKEERKTKTRKDNTGARDCQLFWKKVQNMVVKRSTKDNVRGNNDFYVWQCFVGGTKWAERLFHRNNHVTSVKHTHPK